MGETACLITIVGMAVVTILPRVIPIWLLPGRKIPMPVRVWLKYVPVSVLSAMVVPLLAIRDTRLDFTTSNHFLLAALPAFVAAIITRSLFATLLVGMGTLASLRYFFG